MSSYPTKSAVYAIEQGIVSSPSLVILVSPPSWMSVKKRMLKIKVDQKETIYAGTRGGKVMMFDRRSSRPQYRFNHGPGSSAVPTARPVRLCFSPHSSMRLDEEDGCSFSDACWTCRLWRTMGR